MSLVKSILKMAVPVAVSSYLQSLLRMIENILLPNSLKKYAGNAESGMGIYGSLKGMVMPLLMFPSVFLSSLSVSLVPEISRSISVNNIKRVNHTPKSRHKNHIGCFNLDRCRTHYFFT